MMLFVRLFFLTTLIAGVLHGNAEKLLLKTDSRSKIWWAGSTYKIMQNDPVPSQKGKIVIRSAKNETESFQLVLTPSGELKDISVNISDFRKKGGAIISSENITIRNVEYVHVTKPSGKLHEAGWYPDPLPLYEKPFSAVSGQNTPVWFTVKVPEDAAAGKYTASINLKSDDWEYMVPVELNVWDFSLPETPFIRSGLNLKSKLIEQYHNLDSEEELKQVTDKYFRSFRAYKISPYYFYDLYPIKKKVKGVQWNGGTFDPNAVYEGRYSFRVDDDNTGANVEGSYAGLIEIDPAHPYLLKWQAKTKTENQKYTVTVKCYDANKKPIYWSLKWMVNEGSKNWREDTLVIDTEGFFAFEDLPDYRPFPKNARYASVHLYAVLPDERGSETGTVWFDDFRFIDKKTGENLLPEGNFEQDIDKLDIELDFSEFDKGARKYLDTLGFSGFRFRVPELGKKPFDEIQKKGWFNGFVYGTPEYKKLITLYLKGFQDHLEANGWLGKEYLYWIDEPDQEHYNYVRRGMETIREAAPKLTRFLSENHPGPKIMDVSDIACPVLYQVEPNRVKEWAGKGKQFWSYLMCWPKNPHVNLFIDSHAINMRMWLWISYKYNLKGIVVWQSNQWHRSGGAAPDDVLQNIWEDPMTYKSGYGTPYGSAPEFGNGDGMFFYPPNRDPNNDKTKYFTGPVPSIRLEILREGLDDYDYMMLLENCIKEANSGQKSLVKKAEKVLGFGSEVFVNDTEYTKNPEVLMEYREQMGNLLEQFYNKQYRKR
jgi:hypothetical protein